MQIIVGSEALRNLGFNVTPKDIDIWTDEDLPKQQGYDIKKIPTEILALVPNVNGYATLDALYTIKCSHLGWRNPKWNKHKSDILTLKMKYGASLDEKLFDTLVDFWKVEIDDKWYLSLNKNKDEFFNDNVEYVFDHDLLHELVAHPNQPMYTKCLKENYDVLIDKKLFDKLSFDQQIRMFREEISVIAIERWLVNPRAKGKYSWIQAYSMALEKTITTLTKGWATKFIVLNLEHFVKPDYSYFKYTLEEKLNG